MKKALCLALLLGLLFGMSGCWDYRSLDELTIVSGIAIDLNAENPLLFDVAFEIVDTLLPQEQGQVGSKLIHTSGKTIFEAISNATAQLYTDMYFGNTELVLVSEAVARERGLSRIVDSFMRDFASRDDVLIAIARGVDAHEIIKPSEEGGYIVSHSINRSLKLGEYTTQSARPYRLYQVYSFLTLEADDFALPALSLVQQGQGLPAAAIDGLAVFDADKLVGFLEQDRLVPFLFLCETLKGGTYVFYTAGNEGALADVTLEIYKSTPFLAVDVSGEGLTLCAQVRVKACIVEVSPEIEDLTREGIRGLEEEAAESLSMEIHELIHHVQQQGIDVFGFQDALYRRDISLWENYKDNWTDWFRNAAVELACDVSIESIGMNQTFERQP